MGVGVDVGVGVGVGVCVCIVLRLWSLRVVFVVYACVREPGVSERWRVGSSLLVCVCV